jgi:hypothetical protein
LTVTLTFEEGAMPDLFVNRQTELDSPAYEAFPLVANGSELDVYTRYIYVGGAGSLNVVMASGGTVQFAGVPVGAVLPIRVQSVLSTSSASNLVGLA